MTGSIAIENLAQLFVLFFFYDGPTPPAGVFDVFNAVLPITDQTATQSYASIVSEEPDYIAQKLISVR